MAQLPGPVRATLGLVASVADAIKDGRAWPEKLPDGLSDKALELPVLLVGSALQLSLRAQQQYAALMVRGDALLTDLRGGAPQEPPPWAQFDDDADAGPPTKAAPAKQAPAKKAAAKKAPAKKTPAKKVATKQSVPAPRTGKPSAFDRAGDGSPS